DGPYQDRRMVSELALGADRRRDLPMSFTMRAGCDNPINTAAAPTLVPCRRPCTCPASWPPRWKPRLPAAARLPTRWPPTCSPPSCQHPGPGGGWRSRGAARPRRGATLPTLTACWPRDSGATSSAARRYRPEWLAERTDYGHERVLG